EVVRARLDKYVIMDDVAFEDASAAQALLTVSGPAAAGALAMIGAKGVPEAPFDHRVETLAGLAVRIARGRWTGGPDFDLFVARGSLHALKGAVAGRRGQPGGPGGPAGAFELLALRAG